MPSNKRLPTSAELLELQAAKPGTEYRTNWDPKFVRRMQQSGYLDNANRRTSGHDRLRVQYDTDGLVLFLGAGVSKPSGVPDWRELIDRMLAAIGFDLPSSDETSHSKLLQEKAGLSLLAQFDVVARQCQRKSLDFATLLQSELYGSSEFKNLRALLNAIPLDDEKKTRFDWAPVLAELRKNSTLAAIGDLLVETVDGRVEVNPKIGAVLTTNADPLLRTYVRARAAGRRLLTTVDRASVGDHPGKLSVFHLHGWLDVRDNGPLPADATPLVFRESEYFETIANPNSFANYTAQSLFQRRNVLFIGTSMEDVNVRRWLFNSYEERKRHRAQYLKGRSPQYTAAEVEADMASIRHFWFRRTKDLPGPSAVLQDSITGAMRRLGVEVLWYEEHAEIADRLRSLRNAN